MKNGTGFKIVSSFLLFAFLGLGGRIFAYQIGKSQVMSCDITNYQLYIKSLEKTNQLIRETGMGCQLAGESFYMGHLMGAIFVEANLTGAFFSLEDLEGANFAGANLSRGVLSGTNLKRANFTEANLSQAYFLGAHLAGADLTEAIIDGAIFMSAIYDSETRFPDGFNPISAGMREIGWGERDREWWP